MSELKKGKLLRQDAHLYDGRQKTASRKSSAGGVVVGLRFGDEVDVLAVYGNGVNYTDLTIQTALDAIGSDNTTLKFAPGTWSIKANVTVGSNFACRIAAGVTFDVDSGITLTFNGPLIRDFVTFKSGDGTLTEAGIRDFTGLIDLSGAVLQGGTPLVFEGATANAFETSFVITDPTADRTLTMPDVDVDLTDVNTIVDAPASLTNVGLVTTIAANALTIDMRTKDLGDATATDVAKITFRNATATTGDYVTRSITAALDITVPAGATLGFAANETGFIYIYMLDNAGTVELAVSQVGDWDEGETHNTTIIDTSSDSRAVLYSETARTGVAIRFLGRLIIQTAATPGNWSNVPSVLSIATPNMRNDPIDRSREFTNTNSGSVTVLVSNTNVVNLNLGTVIVGDRILFNWKMDITKGGTTGLTTIILVEESGTAVVEFYENIASVRSDHHQELNLQLTFVGSAIGRVTTAGTLTMVVRMASGGSNGTVAIGGGEIYALVLRSGALT